MGRSALVAASLSLALALAGLACGGKQETGAGDSGAAGATPAATETGRSAPAAEPAAPAPAAAPQASSDWVDPEPPGAQALAEEVVAAPFNQDKTTHLTMTITTLVDRTTGLTGFATGLAGAAVPLSDRLSRLGAEETATEVTIRLPGAVLFDFDSAAIRPDAEGTLGELAAVLEAYGKRPARIEGHTDSIASEAYNQKLSEERAQAVRAWLVAHGVAAGRLTTAGRGESQPVADNATAAGRQLNRRVEVIIAKGGA
jgi:outer membrane protein OmpA-like peptidoglycan-associated protein